MTIQGSIFAAMLTPFNDDGSLAVKGVAPLVDYVLSKGVDGLYVSGSTGESVLQCRDERAAILSELGNYAQDKCTLIAHVGSASTNEAVTLAKLAEKKGFHALSAVPPFYYKHTYSDIADYYKTIVDAVDLPLIIYSIPVLSGIDIPTEKLLELLGDDRIAGIKFTAQDIFQFERLRNAAPDKLFYFGTDEMFLGAAAMGTDGGIGSTYNLIGDVYVGIQNAVAAGDMDTARQLQCKANDLITILLQTGVLPGLKHAMNRLGIPVGPCRKPFGTPSAESIKLLEDWMDRHGLTA